jgi:hypothetical protein
MMSCFSPHLLFLLFLIHPFLFHLFLLLLFQWLMLLLHLYLYAVSNIIIQEVNN